MHLQQFQYSEYFESSRFSEWNDVVAFFLIDA